SPNAPRASQESGKRRSVTPPTAIASTNAFAARRGSAAFIAGSRGSAMIASACMRPTNGARHGPGLEGVDLLLDLRVDLHVPIDVGVEIGDRLIHVVEAPVGLRPCRHLAADLRLACRHLAADLRLACRHLATDLRLAPLEVRLALLEVRLAPLESGNRF